MKYRKSKSEEIGSPRWRNEHRYTLSQWLPQTVLNTDRSLTYVLLHGDDELMTGWSPYWLTEKEAHNFLTFLETEKLSESYEIISKLRLRSNKNNLEKR